MRLARIVSVVREYGKLLYRAEVIDLLLLAVTIVAFGGQGSVAQKPFYRERARGEFSTLLS